MKKIALAALGLGALAGPAFAADMPVKAPPPAPAPAYSWTGCYIGGHFGGLWADKEWTNRTPGSTFNGQSRGDNNVDSWLAGVQAGCDYEFSGGYLVGVQGDYAWTNGTGSHTDPITPAYTDSANIKSLASVTGRAGYAWNRFLGYVKGGGAWERDDYRITGTLVGVVVDVSADETRSGWTAGVGGEYAFTNFLSGFVEYDYYDFGTRDLTFSPDSLGRIQIVGIRETKSVVKAGLNWRFH